MSGLWIKLEEPYWIRYDYYADPDVDPEVDVPEFTLFHNVVSPQYEKAGVPEYEAEWDMLITEEDASASTLYDAIRTLPQVNNEVEAKAIAIAIWRMR